MKKICGVIVILSFIISVALIINNKNISEERKWYCDSIDTQFTTQFSAFLDELNQDTINYDEAEKHIYVCYSVFSLTSYSENEDLGIIVSELNNITAQKTISQIIDSDIVTKLSELKFDYNDKSLTAEIRELILQRKG